MQRNTTSNRFGRRALLLTLLLSTLPRLLRILLNFLNEYVFYGNLNYDEALVSTVTVAADFLGTVSLFAGLAAVIYMAFIGGVRKGGEWVFALIAGYGLSVLILSLSPDIGLGAVLFSLSTVAILLAILLWMKKGRAVAVAVAVTFFLTVIGGLFILIATTVPTAEQILSYSLYGLINVGLELLLMAVALRLVALFRRRAIQKGGDSADIRIGSRIWPGKHPVLLTFLLVDILYTALLVIGAVGDILAWIENYDLPVNGAEWFSLLSPLLVYAVLFVVAYAVMLVTAGRLENAYLASEGESDV
jgi:hypothetical protein